MSEDEGETIEEMFVQLGSGVRSTSDTLTIEGVTPSTLYFSDRPERVVGHVTTEQFVDDWSLGPNSFESDPPNAVLTFPEADGTLDDVVVELSSPHLSNDTLSYTIKVLEGSLPDAAGACSLFIDPFGRPLSPVSVCGMRRRGRRRARRQML
ncbi:MAG: hypothetical protein ACXWBN_05835 [Acidimicrobiales bacterium]